MVLLLYTEFISFQYLYLLIVLIKINGSSLSILRFLNLCYLTGNGQL